MSFSVGILRPALSVAVAGILLSLIWTSVACPADRIRLKNGTVLEGKAEEIRTLDRGPLKRRQGEIEFYPIWMITNDLTRYFVSRHQVAGGDRPLRAVPVPDLHAAAVVAPGPSLLRMSALERMAGAAVISAGTATSTTVSKAKWQVGWRAGFMARPSSWRSAKERRSGTKVAEHGACPQA